MARCQHCYADIREATITEFNTATLLYRTEVEGKAWLNAENRSPWCLRELCSGCREPYEIKHALMPQV